MSFGKRCYLFWRCVNQNDLTPWFSAGDLNGEAKEWLVGLNCSFIQ